MYISQWITTEGTPITPEQFTSWLGLVAQDMHDKGWDVIGSFCKTPNLRPWKGVNRFDLIKGTLEDIRMGRANSLNLRLRDNVIALDCDFHDATLMSKFVRELGRLLGVSPRVFYTVQGSKGGKLFFRYAPQDPSDKPLRRLGPTAYSKGFAGNKLGKQELEVKRDLSTVAGLYGGVTLVDEDGRPFPDAIVYSTYGNTRSILSARPSELLVLTRRDLEAIEALYVDLLRRGQFVYESGEQVSPRNHRLTNIAAVASYMMRVACRQKDKFNFSTFMQDIKNDAEFETVIAPYYTYLRLDDALNMIRRLFHKGPCMDDRDFERAGEDLMELAKGGRLTILMDRASNFGMLTKAAAKRLQQDAQRKGLVKESQTLAPLDLFTLMHQEVAC